MFKYKICYFIFNVFFFLKKNMCGAGIQTRNVSCLGDDGLPADPEKCPPDLDILVLKVNIFILVQASI